MIYESLNEIKDISYETSHEAVELLNSSKIIDYIVKQFKSRQIRATWQANQTSVQVFAGSSEDLTSAVAIMKSSLIDTSRHVTEERIPVVRSDEFKKHIAGIEQDYPGELKLVFSPDGR